MPEPSFPYPESILQWIWEQRLFDPSSLYTECGNAITLVKPGSLNPSDGPDFLNAVVRINGMLWHGSVEIHTSAKHWNNHGHQHDSNYDNVILHVVAEHEPLQIHTKSGSQPFTLNLLSAISNDLQQFLKQYQQKQKNHLPCAGNVKFISDAAFKQQIEISHQEYLEKKTEDFLHFYDPNISQSKAWKQALVISLFDGLGISHNREPMQEAAKLALKSHQDDRLKSVDALTNRILSLDSLSWNLKGCRPNNHPSQRLKTGISFLQEIMDTPFEDFISGDSVSLWKDFCRQAGVSFSGRIKILFGTVYLPALYLLSDLVFSQNLKKSVIKNWRSFKAPIPQSLLKPLQSIPVSETFYQNRLGSVHQLKEYCTKGRCNECEVLKKAILP